jgi:purine-cytosine permease-like protein
MFANILKQPMIYILFIIYYINKKFFKQQRIKKYYTKYQLCNMFTRNPVTR